MWTACLLALGAASCVAMAAPVPSASAASSPPQALRARPAAAASAAAAVQPRYVVQIEAPQDVQGMLAQYLDIERWRSFPDMSPEQLRGLVDKVPSQAGDLLAAQGYFSAHIAVHLDDTQPVPVVAIAVQPGEPTRVQSVDLQVQGPDGHPDAALAAALRKNWRLAPGQVFRSAAWETAKSNALLELLTKRYPAARIARSEALVDPETRAASLTLELDTGPGYTFGPIHVEGLQRYPASIVQRLSPLQPGEPYAQDKLLEWQARLQSSSYFRTALVAAPLADAQGTSLPVLVQVAEQKTQRLGAGLGYSSNTGARTQLDYENLNIGGRAWRLTSAIKLETVQQSLSAGLAFPRTENGSRYSVGADVQHSNIQGLTTRSQVLSAQRQRVDGPIETVQSLQFINERQDVAGSGSTSTMALVPGFSWTRRDLDNPIDPRNGTLINAQIGGASKAVLSDQNFIRLLLRGVDLIALGARNQLIVRGVVGSVISPSAEGIPQQELFRAGGIGSVRGYAYQSLGVVQGNAVVGGRALLTASVEAVHWLTPKWGAAVFYDRGGAADSFGALKTVAGYGVGARWRSPAGLISVDLAYGQATQAVRLQFNAGVNF
ncbi:autotransporter assembly complex family protein [Thiomonas sp. FB-Cd]|uniref:autotransporter assembly complex protein TamA n=1 Tax=Thiomonas sp. FB-Cd TaxID=1158292 RepID=UPI0005710DAA|nr:autotransporter assembly complex family protein [Thiomonas sp. FB-Cd]